MKTKEEMNEYPQIGELFRKSPTLSDFSRANPISATLSHEFKTAPTARQGYTREIPAQRNWEAIRKKRIILHRRVPKGKDCPFCVCNPCRKFGYQKNMVSLQQEII